MSVARYKPTDESKQRKPNPAAFKKGAPRAPGAGRVKGVPNKTTKLLKDALTGSADKLGNMVPIYRTRPVKRNGRIVQVSTGEVIGWKPGEGGMEGYLVWLGSHYPRSYAVLLGRLLPIQLDAKLTTPQTVIEKFKGVDFGSMPLAEKMAAMKEMIGLTRALPAPDKDSSAIVDGEFSEVEET